MRTSRVVVSSAVVAIVAAACGGVGDPAVATEPATSSPHEPGAAPAAPPDVDLAVHDVPLEEIYFDTFDGGAVRLSESTSELPSRTTFWFAFVGAFPNVELFADV